MKPGYTTKQSHISRMRGTRFLFFLGLVSMVFGLPMAFGQGITGRIIGTVQDPTGAVISHAVVTATEQNTGVVSRTSTNASGNYHIDNIMPGTYRIKVSAPGFTTVISTGNVVTVDNANREDFTLKVGQASQSIDVSGENPIVDTTSSSTGQVLNTRAVMNLPLNGRTFSQLTQTLPGSVATGPGRAPEAAAGAGAAGSITASLDGLPWSSTTYTLDGVSDMELLNAFITITPPLDSIQEMNISAANADATVGTYGGAQVNAIMKSGSNQWHGSAYEYFRGDSLNATQWEALTKAPYRSNEFGASLGGPILHNKAFFFLDYQGLLLDNGVAYNLTVPTDEMKQGNFLTSQFPTIYDPTTGKPFPVVDTADGPAYHIDSSRFDSVAARMVAGNTIWPEPTDPNSITQNYKANTTETDNNHQFDVKITYQASSNDRLFFRESYQRRDLTAPSPGTRFIRINDVNAMTRDHNAAFGYDHIFSPTMTNEFRIGFNRFYTKDFGNDFGTNENTALGIPNGNDANFAGASGLAIFQFENVADTGSQDWTNSHRITNIYQFTDNLTKVWKNHTFVFGGDYRRLQASLTNPNASQNGSFSFNSDYTSSCTGQPNCVNSSGGNDFASFLLGLPSSLYRGFVDTDPATRANLAAVYAQDEYRASKSLTLNLALRWDLITHATDKFNRQSNFDLTTGLIDLASGSNPAPNVNNYYGNFAPRVGFSYTPNNGQTAIRGAFGITTFPGNYGALGGFLEREFPFFQEYYLNQQAAYTPWTTLSGNGLPAFNPTPLTPTITPAPNTQVNYMPRNFRPENAYSWNFGVEQRLTATSAFSLNYVGTKGLHLFREYNIDTPEPGPGNLQTRLPYYSIAPNVTEIEMGASNGTSIYHSLQAELTKRFSDGLQGRVAYTWAKEIDDTSVFDPIDNSYNRGLGTNQAPDIPQSFIASAVYQLPFGYGRKWFSTAAGPVRALISGWQFSTITTLQSGTPLTFGVSSDNLNSGFSNRANVTCQHVPVLGSVNEWFDTGCFATPPQYQIGDSGIGKVRGPAYLDADVSLAKSERIRRGMKVTFEADAFNVSNTPHYANPNTTCCTAQNPSFGKITSTNGTPREFQLSAHLTF